MTFKDLKVGACFRFTDRRAGNAPFNRHLEPFIKISSKKYTASDGRKCTVLTDEYRVDLVILDVPAPSRPAVAADYDRGAIREAFGLYDDDRR